MMFNKNKAVDLYLVIISFLFISAYSSQLQAESVAITNTTVYTAEQQKVLYDATIIIENGIVTDINPKQLSADRSVDGSGKVITPGFIPVGNHLGLLEVNSIAPTRDISPEEPSIHFDPAYAYNSNSSLIAYARKGGITESIVFPYQTDNALFSGQAFSVPLKGTDIQLIDHKIAIVAHFGETRKGSRATNLQSLKELLQQHSPKKNVIAKTNADTESEGHKNKLKKTIKRLLSKEIPLVAEASRASDILHLIEIKKQFDIELVIMGGHQANQVAAQLAKENIAVMVEVMENLPQSFDRIHSSLQLAAELERAGVPLILFNSDTHMLMNLRLDAGNAVANGLSRQGAIDALTLTPSNIFKLKLGQILQGQAANLVLWSGDPFEISSHVMHMWINGSEVSVESRADKLYKRYSQQQPQMPAGYNK